MDPFPTNNCSAFFIVAPFPALSILTIFLDKCQMISLKDINIFISENFVFEKAFFGKSFYLRKKVFGNKMFLKKKKN